MPRNGPFQIAQDSPYFRMVPSGGPQTRHLLVAYLALPPDEYVSRGNIPSIAIWIQRWQYDYYEQYL